MTVEHYLEASKILTVEEWTEQFKENERDNEEKEELIDELLKALRENNPVFYFEHILYANSLTLDEADARGATEVHHDTFHCVKIKDEWWFINDMPDKRSAILIKDVRCYYKDDELFTEYEALDIKCESDNLHNRIQHSRNNPDVKYFLIGNEMRTLDE